MKYLKTLSVLGLSLLIAAQVFSVSNPVSARVRAIRGTAKYKANGEWHALRVNDVLKEGTLIQTEKESTVDLFVNQSVIRVTPDTTIGLEKLSAQNTGADNVTETSLYLRTGRVLGNVKKLAAASRYEIKTPNGVTGVRGTDFDVSVYQGAAGGWHLTVTSVQGTLVGAGTNSKGEMKTAVINTGETWSPEEGLNPTPQNLLTEAQGVIFDLTHENKGNPPVIPQPDVIQDPDNNPPNPTASEFK